MLTFIILHTWRLALFVGTPLTLCSFLYSRVSAQPPSKVPPPLLWLSIPAEARTRLNSRPTNSCNWLIYVSMYMLVKYNIVIFYTLLLTCEVFLNIRLYRIPEEDLSLTLSLLETASSEVRFVFMLTVNLSLSFAHLLSLSFVPCPES